MHIVPDGFSGGIVFSVPAAQTSDQLHRFCLSLCNSHCNRTGGISQNSCMKQELRFLLADRVFARAIQFTFSFQLRCAADQATGKFFN